jgi:hypothetical protein
MLGYALTLHDYETWEAASAVWQARLSPEECAAIAWAALRSLDRDHALAVIEAVLDGAGAPLPPFINPMDEAMFWADIASPEELRAYTLATFNRLPPEAQADFLAHVQRRAA